MRQALIGPIRMCQLLLAFALALGAVPAWAAIVFGGAASVAPGETSSLTLSTMNPAAGTLMLAQVSVRGGSEITITPPAGWTLVDRVNNGTTLAQAVYRRVSDGAEPASYAWSFSVAGSSATRYAAGSIQLFSGVDATNPVDAWSKRSNGSSNSVTIDPVTTTVANAMLVAIVTNADGRSNFTAPAGMSERYDTQSGSGQDNALAIASFDVVQAAAGASGTKTASATRSVVSVAHLVALRPGATSVVPGLFNAFETTTAAGSVSGVIRTKVAGSAFALDVVALKTGATAIETAFTGDVRLELIDTAVAAACAAYPLIRTLGTLTFNAADQGRATFTGISEANAWPNARIRISYPAGGTASVVACSTDNFALRPASFAGIAVSDANSLTAGTARALNNVAASGGVVHQAGRPFSIAASAANAAGAVTTNYAGSPLASVTACVLPASGCTLGTLATGVWSAAAGTVTTTDASYTEAGAFSMKLVDASFAAVDAADSSAAEMTIESAPFNVGRFVPDHFDLATAPALPPQFRTFNDATCPTRSFTYVGQPFGYAALPQATITARSASGNVTTNYAGTLWKLTAADATQSYVATGASLDTGLVGTPVLVETGSGTGTLTANAADVIAFVRTTPVAPFSALIDLTMRVSDASENAVSGNGTVETTTPALFDDIAFDAGNEIRFGRLALANAHGSELLALPVLIEAQYWTAAGFARNTADHCTQLSAGQVALSNWQRNLTACETSVTLSGRFASGRGNLRLSAPGEGNSGSVDLTVNLGPVGAGSGCVGGTATSASGASQSWLQGNGGGAAYNQNPAARASFGLHRASKALIYIREMY